MFKIPEPIQQSQSDRLRSVVMGRKLDLGAASRMAAHPKVVLRGLATMATLTALLAIAEMLTKL